MPDAIAYTLDDRGGGRSGVVETDLTAAIRRQIEAEWRQRQGAEADGSPASPWVPAAETWVPPGLARRSSASAVPSIASGPPLSFDEWQRSRGRGDLRGDSTGTLVTNPSWLNFPTARADLAAPLALTSPATTASASTPPAARSVETPSAGDSGGGADTSLARLAQIVSTARGLTGFSPLGAVTGGVNLAQALDSGNALQGVQGAAELYQSLAPTAGLPQVPGAPYLSTALAFLDSPERALTGLPQTAIGALGSSAAATASQAGALAASTPSAAEAAALAQFADAGAGAAAGAFGASVLFSPVWESIGDTLTRWFSSPSHGERERAEAGRAIAAGRGMLRDVQLATSPEELQAVIDRYGAGFAGHTIGSANPDPLAFEARIRAGVDPERLTQANDTLSRVVRAQAQVIAAAQRGVPEAQAYLDRQRQTGQAFRSELLELMRPERVGFARGGPGAADPYLEALTHLGYADNDLERVRNRASSGLTSRVGEIPVPPEELTAALGVPALAGSAIPLLPKSDAQTEFGAPSPYAATPARVPDAVAQWRSMPQGAVVPYAEYQRILDDYGSGSAFLATWAMAHLGIGPDEQRQRGWAAFHKAFTKRFPATGESQFRRYARLARQVVEALERRPEPEQRQAQRFIMARIVTPLGETLEPHEVPEAWERMRSTALTLAKRVGLDVDPADIPQPGQEIAAQARQRQKEQRAQGRERAEAEEAEKKPPTREQAA